MPSTLPRLLLVGRGVLNRTRLVSVYTQLLSARLELVPVRTSSVAYACSSMHVTLRDDLRCHDHFFRWIS